eukprot:CAMPEP_0172047848 /NCGR_PEP_ID=MMETSP1043-20130122/1219_1 /TAXON_ID=464988 /ORGANISM="Hemiselmis andersenii, Strain CCMP441" /LENGTH=151 /DNA_ID=CAMNT_0012706713 /DNA_START=82 /DNA_END=538 /DNA_ORIENTATION=-
MPRLPGTPGEAPEKAHLGRLVRVVAAERQDESVEEAVDPPHEPLASLRFPPFSRKAASAVEGGFDLLEPPPAPLPPASLSPRPQASAPAPPPPSTSTAPPPRIGTAESARTSGSDIVQVLLSPRVEDALSVLLATPVRKGRTSVGAPQLAE